MMLALKVLHHLQHRTTTLDETDDLDTLLLIEKLLLQVHPALFQPLSHFDFTKMTKQQIFLQIISLIGNYLNFQQYKRLNKDFQKTIIATLDINKLITLSIYITMNNHTNSHNEIRNELIVIILDLDEQQQQQIMKLITQIDRQCQDLLELKKAISRIGVLEQQNQLLRQKLTEQLEQTQRETNKYDEVQGQYQYLLNQIKQYKKQKYLALNLLQVNSIAQYSTLCRQIKEKNHTLEYNIQQLEKGRAHAISYNAQIKQQLKKNGKIIQSQIQSIQSLKKLCKELNYDHFARLQKEYDCQVNLPLLPLQQNNNANNIRRGLNSQRSKFETARTACSTQRQDVDDEYQRHNLQRLLILKKLQVQQTQKMKMIADLKQKYDSEVIKERQLKLDMKRLMIQHKNYMNSYQLLGKNKTTKH